MLQRFLFILSVSALVLPDLAWAGDKIDPFAIAVVDDQTGRGVPLVQLRTTNDVCYYTDSNGLVAFAEPGLMGQSVFFFVQSAGYEFPKDGFGYRGKALKVKAGGSATLRIKRLNIAERLYRLTGGDIYRDTVLLGRKAPIQAPLLNGLVFGSDSVENAVYRSKIFWFWGDTNRPSYPLGNFNSSGATSLLPGKGGLDPNVGVDLNYFVDEHGFARGMAPMPGDGPTWIDGLVVLHEGGRERMFCPYMKVHAQMKVYARGLVEFDDATQRFRKVADFPLKAPVQPAGHPFLHTEAGIEYVYFPKPFPLVRVRATAEDLKDLSHYEAYTCLQTGSSLADRKLDRSPEGTLHYAWKHNTPVVSQADQKKLANAGAMKPSEGLIQFRDRDTGKTVLAHNGSVYWNPYRGHWITIMCESAGTSYLGEIWYAEADTPTGPWTYATKILTHDRYSFYNPKQDPMFDQDGGRVIYFEGTYTSSFSGNPFKTPRYDYNQMMYRLDLADPRLVMPVAVYPTGKLGLATLGALPAPPTNEESAFFACDRPSPGMVPVFGSQDDPSAALHVGPIVQDAKPLDAKPLFYAVPLSANAPPATTVPLFEWVSNDGKQRLYATEESSISAGFRRTDKALCRVWNNPRSLAGQR